jgi:uncharacterized protein YndB with AHSA1/START domain
MLKKILIGGVVLVLIFVAVIALQPADFKIVRSATIAAPAALVFAEVNDFHKWEAWSPWAKRDPAMKQTYAGAEAGIGSAYSWEGNSEVGAGRMTLTESRANELVRIKLEFLKPFKAENLTEFSFQEANGKETTVTWSMEGRNNVLSKAYCLFMDMDKMVGADFEQGLAQMKAIAESKK